MWNVYRIRQYVLQYEEEKATAIAHEGAQWKNITIGLNWKLCTLSKDTKGGEHFPEFDYK